MTEYTPTTEEVRHAHVGKQAVCVNHGDWITEEQWAEFGAEFDRWLASVKADAWEEGFDAGERDVFEHDEGDEWGKEHTCIQNPYRQGETE